MSSVYSRDIIESILGWDTTNKDAWTIIIWGIDMIIQIDHLVRTAFSSTTWNLPSLRKTFANFDMLVKWLPIYHRKKKKKGTLSEFCLVPLFSFPRWNLLQEIWWWSILSAPLHNNFELKLLCDKTQLFFFSFFLSGELGAARKITAYVIVSAFIFMHGNSKGATYF